MENAHYLLFSDPRKKILTFLLLSIPIKKTHFLLLVVNSQEMLSPIQDVIHFFGSTDPSTLAGPKFRKCSGREFRSRKCSDQFTFWAPAQILQLVPCSAKKVRVWLTG